MEYGDIVEICGQDYKLVAHNCKPTLVKHIEPKYKAGDCFVFDNGLSKGNVVMLAQVDYGKYTVIDILSGNRYTEPVDYGTHNFTIDDVCKMCGRNTTKIHNISRDCVFRGDIFD